MQKSNNRIGKKKLSVVMTGVYIMAVLLSGCSKKETSFLLEETGTEPWEISTEETTWESEGQTAEYQEEKMLPESCFVHVCGAVKYPGVYELPTESRIFEAVEAAGGLTKEACGEYLNQAEKISDGMKIFIPTTEQVENQMVFEEQKEPVKEENDTKQKESLVNINTADRELLMTLPGIGESRAESIISYRKENGCFTKIEEIMQVSGIKDGAYQKLKDKICVD